MRLPFMLRRGLQVIEFHAGLPAGQRFRRHDEAVAFFRFWAGDPAAMATLRALLREAMRAGPLFALSDAQVIEALAACLLDGSIALGAGHIVEPALPASGGAPVAPAAAAPAIKSPAPPIPPNPPSLVDALLAVIEQVAVEAADVRPEVEAALAELDLGQAQVDFATVSLAPTPSKIDPISTQMSQASAGAVETIDGL
jgi:hypothetical protein